MQAAEPSQTTRDLELTVLRSLCQLALDDSVGESNYPALQGYRWEVEDHRVAFEALQKSRAGNPKALREEMAAHATRMGFPDIDWSMFFKKCDEVRDVEALISQLKKAAPHC